MGVPAGTHKLGPDNATLRINTTREGAAAKAGHNLVIEVGSWDATVTIGDAPSVQLNADTSSLEVIEGSGGAMALGDDDKVDIKKSIKDKILKDKPVKFTSTQVTTTDAGMSVAGDLEIVGKSQPVSFDVSAVDGKISASTTVTQSDFGIKQFSALFGALKVGDVVTVTLDGSV